MRKEQLKHKLMPDVNWKLKARIIEYFGTQVDASRNLEMDEYRLSRIIHGRAKPTKYEKKLISKKLKLPICEIFT